MGYVLPVKWDPLINVIASLAGTKQSPQLINVIANLAGKKQSSQIINVIASPERAKQSPLLNVMYY
jgi:hypothetical protein